MIRYFIYCDIQFVIKFIFRGFCFILCWWMSVDYSYIVEFFFISHHTDAFGNCLKIYYRLLSYFIQDKTCSELPSATFRMVKCCVSCTAKMSIVFFFFSSLLLFPVVYRVCTSFSHSMFLGLNHLSCFFASVVAVVSV